MIKYARNRLKSSFTSGATKCQRLGKVCLWAGEEESTRSFTAVRLSNDFFRLSRYRLEKPLSEASSPSIYFFSIKVDEIADLETNFNIFCGQISTLEEDQLNAAFFVVS